MDVETPEFESEEVMFRKDGTIVWKVDGQRTLLRRPKFKELRTLREEIALLADESREERQAIVDRLNALSKPLTDRLEGIDSETDPTANAQITAIEEELRTIQESDEWTAIQDELRGQRTRSDQAMLAWFRDSILVRFGKPVVVIDDPEDLPPWVTNKEFVGELLEHWSSVPRRPGVV